MMFPKLKKLLLVTDGSLYSEGAIREAISLAKKCSGKLYAIFVLETNPEYETIGSNFFDKEESEAISHLESIRSSALESGVDCGTIFHHGEKAYQYIVDEAAERRADMIIIGRRGRKGLAKLMIGETAAKVITHTSCNVLVVPKAAKIRCRNILVATNGSNHSSSAISEAIGIAKCCGSSIVVVSSLMSDNELEEAKSNVNKVVELAQEEGLHVEVLTPFGKTSDAVIEIASGRGVDLIVMGRFGKKGVKLFKGSPTEKVIGNSGCAVLVAKSQ
ncbi:MAG: universal stress protein [Nitrospirae bacterium]|nr:universal stress protein [Nitrospirota bacterium]